MKGVQELKCDKCRGSADILRSYLDRYYCIECWEEVDALDRIADVLYNILSEVEEINAYGSRKS